MIEQFLTDATTYNLASYFANTLRCKHIGLFVWYKGQYCMILCKMSFLKTISVTLWIIALSIFKITPYNFKTL